MPRRTNTIPATHHHRTGRHHLLTPADRLSLAHAAHTTYDAHPTHDTTDLTYDLNAVEAETDRIAADLLTTVAHRIRHELVCCNIYDRLHHKPFQNWADAERADFTLHQVCYWSGAAEAIVRDTITSASTH